METFTLSTKKLQRRGLIFSIVSLLIGLLSLAISADEQEYTDVDALQDDMHECVVLPYSMLDLSSGVSGRLGKVHVDRAEFIKEGQILAELESEVERANLRLAQVRANLTSEVKLREAGLEYDSRRKKRIHNLNQKRVASHQEADDAERDAVLARWRVAVAKDNLRLARLEARRAEAILDLREVSSPFDGVVVERFKSPGEYVDEEPILRIARLDPLRVEVIVPIEQRKHFKAGLTAEVFPEIKTDQPWRATITAVDVVGDPASGTFRARMELPNPDQSLLAGVKCTTRLVEPSNSDARIFSNLHSQ